MIGLGTLINTALVVAGGIAGMRFGRFITPRLQDGLMKATALSVLFVGLAGALGGMLSVADGKLELTVMNRADAIAKELTVAMAEVFTNGSTEYYHYTDLTYITKDNVNDYIGKGEF